MAISMVRQPSETPNVTNIDDIIPFRYAYGDQNGYVIGKGQELSYTINGRDFRVNSGRVVLNGVESDVDANGVTFTIDNASETRYYVVYYQVNLATNTTDILLSNFSTTGYPVIDIGEDLTTNHSGLARMELYRFQTNGGVIGNVEKVIKAIEYTKNITVENSKNSKNSIVKDDGTFLGFNLDENGVLKVGDIIVPQKRLLWSNDSGASLATWNEVLKAGDTVEITYGLWLNRQIVKGTLYIETSGGNPKTELYIRTDYGYFTTTNAYQTAIIDVSSTSAEISRLAYGNHDYPETPLIYKIVKVIE